MTMKLLINLQLVFTSFSILVFFYVFVKTNNMTIYQIHETHREVIKPNVQALTKAKDPILNKKQELSKQKFTRVRTKPNVQLTSVAKYTILKNFFESDTKNSKLKLETNSVTLVTQATIDYISPHVEMTCDKWSGPISLAIFAPGSDLLTAIQAIKWLQNCSLPCIRKNITWHLITSHNSMREIDAAVTKSQLYTTNCTKQTLLSESSFRKTKKLSYPINIARNVAREAVATKYVFSTDLELYPSLDLEQDIIKLTKRLGNQGVGNHVYFVPTFEIAKEVKNIPTNKAELYKLFVDKKAFFFHASLWNWRSMSQPNLRGGPNPVSPAFYFQDQEKWFDADIKSNFSHSNEDIFISFQRDPTYKWGRYFEPFFIGTNLEPHFDVQMSWEGQRNKYSQAYEMCLKNYTYHVLQKNFQVHAPGIKKSSNDRHRKEQFKHENRKNSYYMNKIYKQLDIKYNKTCT